MRVSMYSSSLLFHAHQIQSAEGTERIMGEPTRVEWLRGSGGTDIDYFGKNPYISVVHDGDKFLMFYPSFHLPEKPRTW
jgi:hypothetical protein